MNFRSRLPRLAVVCTCVLLFAIAGTAEPIPPDEGADPPDLSAPAVPKLRPKMREKNLESDFGEDDGPLLTPKSRTGEHVMLRPADRVRPRPPFSISTWLHTPLFYQDTFDQRFSTIGGAFALSAPLIPIGSRHYLFGEVGLGLTLSRLSITQPDLTFTHMYFWVPFRLRAIFAINKLWSVEAQGGCQFRMFEYDSRPTLDGGFRLVTPLLSNIEPDIAVGVRYRIGDHTRLRGFLGYLFLGAGVEWIL